MTPSTNKCCEKCRRLQAIHRKGSGPLINDLRPMEFCGNPDCPCHKPTEPRVKKWEKNKATHDITMSAMAPSYCRRCNKSGYELGDVPCPNKPTEPSVTTMDEITTMMEAPEPSVCGVVDNESMKFGARLSDPRGRRSCPNPSPCKDHGWREAVAEEQKKDAEVGRKVREEESPWRETKDHGPSEVCGFKATLTDGSVLTCELLTGHDGGHQTRHILLAPQQEEESWEERFDREWSNLREGYKGEAMIDFIRTEIAQAEKRGEVRALEWVVAWAKDHYWDSVDGEMATLHIEKNIKDRLTALKNPTHE